MRKKCFSSKFNFTAFSAFAHRSVAGCSAVAENLAFSQFDFSLTRHRIFLQDFIKIPIIHKLLCVSSDKDSFFHPRITHSWKLLMLIPKGYCIPVQELQRIFSIIHALYKVGADSFFCLYKWVTCMISDPGRNCLQRYNSVTAQFPHSDYFSTHCPTHFQLQGPSFPLCLLCLLEPKLMIL